MVDTHTSLSGSSKVNPLFSPDKLLKVRKFVLAQDVLLCMLLFLLINGALSIVSLFQVLMSVRNPNSKMDKRFFALIHVPLEWS